MKDDTNKQKNKRTITEYIKDLPLNSEAKSQNVSYLQQGQLSR